MLAIRTSGEMMSFMAVSPDFRAERFDWRVFRLAEVDKDDEDARWRRRSGALQKQIASGRTAVVIASEAIQRTSGSLSSAVGQ
jgi:hypothetical protein